MAFSDIFSSFGGSGTSSIPWQQLIAQLGHGMIGARDFGSGLQAGVQNLGQYAQRQQYQDSLAKMFAPGTPNPVGVTPAVNDTSPGADQQRAAAQTQNAQPDFAGAGPLAGSNIQPLLPFLQQLDAGTALPLLLKADAFNLTPKTQTLTPDEVKAAGLPPGTVAQKDPNGKINVISAPKGMTEQEKNDFVWKQNHEYHAPVQPSTDRDVLMPILQKMQAGQPLTPGEQQVLNTMKPQAAPAAGDPTIDAVAQQIASYQQAPPAARSMSTPRGLAIMARVHEINPDYSVPKYNASNKAYSAFTSGKQGDQVRALNVSIQHLDVLGDTSKALANGNVKLVNNLAQTYAEQTGQAPPTNFEAVKKLVGAEITKAVVSGGGALADREEIAQTLSRAASPAQLAGVVNNYKYLLAGQMHGLKKQYETSTMRKDFNTFLLPETVTALEHSRAPTTQGGDGWSIKLKGQ